MKRNHKTNKKPVKHRHIDDVPFYSYKYGADDLPLDPAKSFIEQKIRKFETIILIKLYVVKGTSSTLKCFPLKSKYFHWRWFDGYINISPLEAIMLMILMFFPTERFRFFFK